VKHFYTFALKKPYRVLHLVFLSLTFLALGLITGCGTNEPTKAAITDIDITLRVEPNPPAVGDSTLTVTLKDMGGKPINNATLGVHGNMGHDGMDPLEGTSNTATNGEYHIPFRWTMGGDWQVVVEATLPDGQGVFKKSFDLFVEAVGKESIVNQSHGMAGMETPTGSP